MTPDRLSSLRDRHGDVQRELESLAGAKPASENAALQDLESALMRELNQIERQITQIKAYLNKCESVPPRD